jgi:hypothetical protein
MFEIEVVAFVALGFLAFIATFRLGYRLGKVDGRLEIMKENMEEYSKKLGRAK